MADDFTATAAPLRVGLEPGYDDGRIGAWLLDLPGGFGWARTPALARSQSLSVAGRLREWLEAHGDSAGIPPMRGSEIVEEVPAVRGPDGSERNALFAADRRPVSEAELRTTLRRIDHARADLLELLGRVDAHERAAGPLPVDGPRVERTSDEVARHLGSSETWLASRLDGTARYEGAPRDGDRDAYLAATRAWATEQLRTLWERDPALERIDGRGEEWTLAKVCRRLVYHALDHLWELDRRLARVDGTAEAVEVRLDRLPSVDDVVALLRTVGWDHRVAEPDRVAAAIEGSWVVATAWHDGRLVGMARLVSDGAINAFLAMVIVHPRYQGLGVGRRVVSTILDGRPEQRVALASADGLEDWYATFGFEPDPRALVRRRPR